jgi:integrase
MASLQQINDNFYVRFRFGGKPIRRSLETSNFDEAEAARLQVELTLHRIKTGVQPAPPAEADLALYILSGGKIEKKAVLLPPPPPPESLRTLWDAYRASFPEGAKDSLPTEKVHFGHFFRLLGEDTAVKLLTTDDLQGYINARLREPGRYGRAVAPDTVEGELETLAHIWNTFARPRKMVPLPFVDAFGELHFGKRRSREPFRTWEQIEQRLGRATWSKEQAKEMWDCLFLDLERTTEVLNFVRDKKTFSKWAYPMFVFAAHTGARRSEMIRSELDDWDFGGKVVQIRERKRNSEVEFTYRFVAISPLLADVMQCWLGTHPGGLYLLCDYPGEQLARNDAAKEFRRTVKGSKWDVLRGWHIFRHSFASNMACKGIDQRFIDATLGHQTEEMRRRYRHLFPSQQHEVMASIFAER